MRVKAPKENPELCTALLQSAVTPSLTKRHLSPLLEGGVHNRGLYITEIMRISA